MAGCGAVGLAVKLLGAEATITEHGVHQGAEGGAVGCRRRRRCRRRASAQERAGRHPAAPAVDGASGGGGCTATRRLRSRGGTAAKGGDRAWRARCGREDAHRTQASIGAVYKSGRTKQGRGFAATTGRGCCHGGAQAGKAGRQNRGAARAGGEVSVAGGGGEGCARIDGAPLRAAEGRAPRERKQVATPARSRLSDGDGTGRAGPRNRP